MPTIQQTAEAFAAGNTAKCHNAHTSHGAYVLHRSAIAKRMPDGTVWGDWCGYYTRTTAAHLNAIANALGSPVRVSYAQARDSVAGPFRF